MNNYQVELICTCAIDMSFKRYGGRKVEPLSISKSLKIQYKALFYNKQL